jgi:hypothetical protein
MKKLLLFSLLFAHIFQNGIILRNDIAFAGYHMADINDNIGMPQESLIKKVFKGKTMSILADASIEKGLPDKEKKDKIYKQNKIIDRDAVSGIIEINDENKNGSVSKKRIFTYIPGDMRFIDVPHIQREDRIEAEPATTQNKPLIVVDGFLNDPLWKKAIKSGNFWSSLENKPPTDQTEVLVASDDFYLYFGIRLYESEPQKIQARETVRDVGFGYDDSITIQMDTFFNRRDITEFSLNPLGTQTDRFAGGRSDRIEWKGDWFGGAARTEYGWSAEFAIPYAILNYPQNSQVFGINFKRYQSRTTEYSWWADVTPKVLPEKMGQLRGLNLPSFERLQRKTWTFMPFVFAGKNIPDKEREIKDTLFTGGVDIRYTPRSDITGMISLNPDFSQVETAVTDISFSYSEKAIADNRPFFVEGLGYFLDIKDRNKYFYTNSIPDIDYGGKGFGKIGNTNFGLLATRAPGDRFDGVGRVMYELDDTHSATMTIAATKQDLYENVLALVQFEGRQKKGLEYFLDAAISETRDVEARNTPEGRGNHFLGILGWKSDYWYLNTQADHYDAEFFPAIGLLAEDLRGTSSVSLTSGYYREQSDHFWRVLDGYAGFSYRQTEDGMLQRRKWFAGTSVEFQNQIRTRLYVEEGPYREVTEMPGVFEDDINQDRYYSTAIDFNTRSRFFSFGSQYDWGKLGGGDYKYWLTYGWLRPVDQIYMKLSYEQTKSFGESEQIVAVGSWEITPENSLGVRYIYFKGDGPSQEFYRIAYARKVRQGLDIFILYENEPSVEQQGSIKFVLTF